MQPRRTSTTNSCESPSHGQRSADCYSTKSVYHSWLHLTSTPHRQRSLCYRSVGDCLNSCDLNGNARPAVRQSSSLRPYWHTFNYRRNPNASKRNVITCHEHRLPVPLRCLYEGDNGELDNGILSLSSLEVAQLDNNPNFPENGKFELVMRGGR